MATEYESAGPAPGQELDDPEHVAAVAEVAQQRQAILQEIKKVIVGQDKVIEELLIALLARGHCLLVGVPGLAKTLLISTLANVLHLRFNRIQFTPDLMPSDITGTDILEEDQETRHRHYRFLQGPIFANIVLADEINRTPPKTQAALLQAMQEYRVTAGGRTYNLDLPFFVLATQNPIEQEGTYPLPEAQLDRFMFHIGMCKTAHRLTPRNCNVCSAPPRFCTCRLWCGRSRPPAQWLAMQCGWRRVHGPIIPTRPRSSKNGSTGGLAHGLPSISFWVPRRVPSCTDALPLPSTMSGPWRPPSCGIVS